MSRRVTQTLQRWRGALRTSDSESSVLAVTPRNSPSRYTLALDADVWNAITKAAGLDTEREQAIKLGVSRGFLNRVRNGRAAPGPEFIAQARIAFPTVDANRLFPIVQKVAS